MAKEIKIHKVIEGPFEDEEDGYWCLCLAEDDGELYDIEVFFDEFDEAYTFKMHFTKSINPIIMETDDEAEHDA
jgi:hypothetical protein